MTLCELEQEETEEEFIETGLYELRGSRRCILSFSRNSPHSAQAGSLVLECMETHTQFPFFHLQWRQTVSQEEEQNYTRAKPETGVSYTEIRHIVSHQEQQDIGESQQCYIVFGFKIIEERSKTYFENNWKEASGLARVILFLTTGMCSLTRASLLKIEDDQEGEFQLCVVVSVRPGPGEVIHLLDLVQRTREARNTGYLSLYRRRDTGRRISS